MRRFLVFPLVFALLCDPASVQAIATLQSGSFPRVGESVLNQSSLFADQALTLQIIEALHPIRGFTWIRKTLGAVAKQPTDAFSRSPSLRGASKVLGLSAWVAIGLHGAGILADGTWFPLLIPLSLRRHRSSPDPEEAHLKLASDYYRVKAELRASFIGAQAERYHQAYEELLRIESAVNRVLENPEARQGLLLAARQVQQSEAHLRENERLPSDEIIHAAGQSLSAKQRSIIADSARWLTDLALEKPEVRHQVRQEMVAATDVISLSRRLPSRISGAEPDEETIAWFESALYMPAAMTPLGLAALVYHEPDPPHALGILVDAKLSRPQLRATWRHEGIHYLAHRGLLPISPTNEMMTSMVDALDTLRSGGMNALKRIGDGYQAILLDRGREHFKAGGSISDLAALIPLLASASDEAATAPSTQRTEDHVAQQEESLGKLKRFATVDERSSLERALGYIAMGYLWEKHLASSPQRSKVARRGRDESKRIDHAALDRDLFAYLRQVIALEIPREPTSDEIIQAHQRLSNHVDRARLLLNDPALEFVPWQPLWPGDRPSWRYVVDFQTGQPAHLFQFVPEDVIQRDDKTLRGFLYLQIFRAKYSFPILPEALRRDPHLWALWNSLEQARVIPAGLERWRGVKSDIAQLFDDRFALIQETKSREDYESLPPYLQFIESAQYEWWQGLQGKSEPRDPRLRDAEVQKVLDETRSARERMVQSASAEEALAITSHEIFPLLQPLLERSREAMAAQHLREQGRLAEKATEEMIREAINAMTPSEREQLVQAIEQSLSQMEQRQSQTSGSGQRPNRMQPLFEPQEESSTLPEPGHESAASAPAGGKSVSPSSIQKAASKAAESAGEMAKGFGELAEMAGQARDSAGEVSQKAKDLHAQAASESAPSPAGELAKSAGDVSQQMEEMAKDAARLDQDVQGLKQDTEQLARDMGAEGKTLSDESKQFGARAAALRAKAESALEQLAKPLQERGRDLAQRLTRDAADRPSPDRVRQQAQEAQQQADALVEKLKALQEKALQTQEAAKKVEETTSASSKASVAKGSSTRISGNLRIRPLPTPPPSQEPLKPAPVPKQNTLADRGEPDRQSPDSSVLSRAIEEQRKALAAAAAAREPLTKSQQAILERYFAPIRPAIAMLRGYIQELFNPLYEALRERDKRSGRLDSRTLTRAVVEDRPRAFTRPGQPQIPKVRWSLLVDVSDSMLEGVSNPTRHSSIQGTKLEYANQAGMLFAEALLEEDFGEPRPGHESEIVLFSNEESFPETGGWAIVKGVADSWSRSQAVNVLDLALNVYHGGTRDFTAIKATLERGKGADIDEHIVIVISDGQSTEGLQNKINRLRKNHPKAKVIGIGIGQEAEAVAMTYAPTGIVVSDVSKLPNAIRQVLQENMQRIIDRWKSGASFMVTRWRAFIPTLLLMGIVAGVSLLWSMLAGGGEGHGTLLFALAAIPPLVPGGQSWSELAAARLEAFRSNHERDREAMLEALYKEVARGLRGQEFRGLGGERVPDVPIYALAQNIENLRHLERVARHQRNRMSWLWGEHGTGKNYLIDLFAAMRQQPRTILSSHEDMTVDEIFEKQVLDRFPGPPGSPPVTETRWVLTEFAEALIRGDIAVWDEFDKMPDKVKAAMNDALQEREFTRKNGEVVRFAPEALVIVTSNPPGHGNVGGHTTGEGPDRFEHIHVDYLPQAQEEQLLAEVAPGLDLDVIHRLVTVANEIRSARSVGIDMDPISTRELEMLVKHLERFPEDLGRIPSIFRQVYLPPDTRPDLDDKLSEMLLAQGLMDQELPDLRPSDWSVQEVTIGTGKSAQKRRSLCIGSVCMPLRAGVKNVPASVIQEIEKIPTNLRRMQDMMKALLLGQHLMIEGDSGTGKDWAIHALLNALEYPLFLEPMNENTIADDLVGWDELKQNKQEWHPGKIALAVEADGIFYGSEANRAKPGTTAILYNFLQNKFIQLTNGRQITHKDKRHFRVILSINPNRPPYKTYPMTPALRSRFKKLRFDYLPYEPGKKEEEIDLLHGRYPGVPRPVAEKLVKGATVLRGEFKKGTGDLPLGISVRTLEKVMEALWIDPTLYAGKGAVAAFLRAYGAISKGVVLQKVIEDIITKVLGKPAIALDDISRLQPIEMEDEVFQALLQRLQNSSGKDSESAAEAIASEVYARRLASKEIPEALPEFLEKVAIHHSEATSGYLTEAVHWMSPTTSVVTGDLVLDRTLSRWIQGNDPSTRMQAASDAVTILVNRRLNGAWIEKPAAFEAEIGRLEMDYPEGRDLIESIRQVYDAWPQWTSGDDYLDRLWGALVNPRTAANAVRNIPALEAGLDQWLSTAPTSDQKSNVVNLLRWLSEYPLLPATVRTLARERANKLEDKKGDVREMPFSNVGLAPGFFGFWQQWKWTDPARSPLGRPGAAFLGGLLETAAIVGLVSGLGTSALWLAPPAIVLAKKYFGVITPSGRVAHDLLTVLKSSAVALTSLLPFIALPDLSAGHSLLSTLYALLPSAVMFFAHPILNFLITAYRIPRLAMADRWGAHPNPGRIAAPIYDVELPAMELIDAKKEVAKILPALEPTLDKITGAWYVSPKGRPGSAGLVPHKANKGEWELILDETLYKDLSVDARKLVMMMHLAADAAELKATPEGQLPEEDINRELIGMIAQRRLYWSINDAERETLRHLSRDFDNREVDLAAIRFSPIVALYDKLGSDFSLEDPTKQAAMLESLARYPNLNLSILSIETLKTYLDYLFGREKLPVITENKISKSHIRYRFVPRTYADHSAKQLIKGENGFVFNLKKVPTLKVQLRAHREGEDSRYIMLELSYGGKQGALNTIRLGRLFNDMRQVVTQQPRSFDTKVVLDGILTSEPGRVVAYLVIEDGEELDWTLSSDDETDGFSSETRVLTRSEAEARAATDPEFRSLFHFEPNAVAPDKELSTPLPILQLIQQLQWPEIQLPGYRTPSKRLSSEFDNLHRQITAHVYPETQGWGIKMNQWTDLESRFLHLIFEAENGKLELVFKDGHRSEVSSVIGVRQGDIRGSWENGTLTVLIPRKLMDQLVSEGRTLKDGISSAGIHIWELGDKLKLRIVEGASSDVLAAQTGAGSQNASRWHSTMTPEQMIESTNLLLARMKWSEPPWGSARPEYVVKLIGSVPAHPSGRLIIAGVHEEAKKEFHITVDVSRLTTAVRLREAVLEFLEKALSDKNQEWGAGVELQRKVGEMIRFSDRLFLADSAQDPAELWDLIEWGIRRVLGKRYVRIAKGESKEVPRPIRFSRRLKGDAALQGRPVWLDVSATGDREIEIFYDSALEPDDFLRAVIQYLGGMDRAAYEDLSIGIIQMVISELQGIRGWQPRMMSGQFALPLSVGSAAVLPFWFGLGLTTISLGHDWLAQWPWFRPLLRTIPDLSPLRRWVLDVLQRAGTSRLQRSIKLAA